ncbi:hypothetical protein [Pseudomonas chlororaphis]|uniref:hypothetical protein n=1 Tax=Pseudomonas chlororaphis TaxID=587753 RepID=UPI0013DE1D8A|nr:hypothetical protein [Pseudomonas chlororaphis]
MVVAEYELKSGLVISSELPILDEGESITIKRCFYQGQSSLLIAIECDGRVAEEIVFPGLIAGRVPVELIQQQ